MHRSSRNRKSSDSLAASTAATTVVDDAVPRWLVASIIGVCLVPIVSFWWVWRFGYTSDHVISGLMAKSILHRGERPLFLWMLGYNGILIESYAVAGFFWLFGETPRIYYLFSTLAFAGLASFLYAHVKPRYGAVCAILTPLFFVLSAPRIYYYVMRPQPNYTEIFIFGMALMHLSAQWLDLVWRERRASEWSVVSRAAACGFLVGFGLYTYQLILFFIGSIGLWMLSPYVEDLANRQARVAPSFMSVWRSLVGIALFGAASFACAAACFAGFGSSPEGRNLATTFFRFGALAVATGCAGEYVLARYDTIYRHLRSLLAFVGAAVCGYAPSLVFTYLQHGHSRDRLRVSLDPTKVWQSFQLYLEAQQRFLNVWDGPRTTIVGALILACSAAFFGHSLWTLHRVSRRQLPKESLRRTTPLALLPLVTTGLFCFAAAAEDWESARWTVGLSMFFALAQAWVVACAFRHAFWLRSVAVAGALLVLSHNALALTDALTSPESQQFHGEELVAALRAKGIRRAYGTYWYCYNIAFFTNEDIIIEPVFNNYSPHYAKEVAGAPRLAFVDDLSPRLTQFPQDVRLGPYHYKKTDSWFGQRAGFVVLERIDESPSRLQ